MVRVCGCFTVWYIGLAQVYIGLAQVRGKTQLGVEADHVPAGGALRKEACSDLSGVPSLGPKCMGGLRVASKKPAKKP